MKNSWLYFLVGLSLLLYKCSGDNEDSNPGPQDTDAPAVAGVAVDDISNNGDGSDLEISFVPVSDESKIAEYRVIVVRTDVSVSFDLATAEGLESARYTALEKNGLNKKITLGAASQDSGGETITQSVSYTVFVLSVADGTNATLNTLSPASRAITLEETTVKITYIGNDGVHITDGENSVIIDALTGNLTSWKPANVAAQSSIERGSGDFQNIRVAMVTHNHGDHFSPNSINSFLGNNSQATLIAPPQVLGSVNSTSQVSNLNPARGTSAEATFGNIRVKVISLRHFDMFGNNFSGVENFGYLVELGGKKILHLGDFDYTNSNLSPFNLKSENIDAVLIPTFSTLISTANKAIIDGQIGAKKVICLHLLSSTTLDQVRAVYPDAAVFTSSLQFERL